MPRAVLVFLLLVCNGCAMLLPSGLETVSTLLTLGSIGQTLIQVTWVDSDKGKLAVGHLPVQYAADTDRMIREAWEQNYELVKTVRWEAEEVSWTELVTATARKSIGTRARFALVARSPLRSDLRTEEITIYKTPSGRYMRDPAQSPGESCYLLTQSVEVSVPVYLYTVRFFAPSRQPSGILPVEGAWDGPCRSAYGYGAAILAVGANTPGAKAGLSHGDVIVAVNGRETEYANLFSLLRPGGNTLSVCREGRHGTKTLTLPEHGRAP